MASISVDPPLKRKRRRRTSTKEVQQTAGFRRCFRLCSHFCHSKVDLWRYSGTPSTIQRLLNPNEDFINVRLTATVSKLHPASYQLKLAEYFYVAELLRHVIPSSNFHIPKRAHQQAYIEQTNSKPNPTHTKTLDNRSSPTHQNRKPPFSPTLLPHTNTHKAPRHPFQNFPPPHWTSPHSAKSTSHSTTASPLNVSENAARTR